MQDPFVLQGYVFCFSLFCGAFHFVSWEGKCGAGGAVSTIRWRGWENFRANLQPNCNRPFVCWIRRRFLPIRAETNIFVLSDCDFGVCPGPHLPPAIEATPAPVVLSSFLLFPAFQPSDSRTL